MGRARGLVWRGFGALVALVGVPLVQAQSPPQPSHWGARYAHGDEIDDIGVRARWSLAALEGVPGTPSLFAEAGADYWSGPRGNSGNRSLFDASLVAGLRWRPAEAWFVDASFAPHLLTDTELGDKGFGIALQFASRLAVGAAFGEARRHEIDVFVEHLSNASLAQPNNGVTFFGLEYRCAMR